MSFSKYKEELGKLAPQEMLICVFCGLGCLASTSMAFVFLSVGGERGLVLFGFAGSFSIPILTYLWKRSMTLSSSILLIISALAIAMVADTKKGLADEGMYWLVVLPLVGGLLNRRRGVKIGAVLQWSVISFYGFKDFFLGINISTDDYAVIIGGQILCQIVVPVLVWQFLKVNDWELNSKTRKVDTLLKIVTHDIANPLTVIHGMSEALLSFHEPEPKVKNVLDKIHKSSTDIREILTRVKNLQAMKSSKLKVKLSKVELKTLLDQVRTTFELKLLRKDLSLIIDYSGNESISVLAEPITLRNDVINNLVSNAIKFSEYGNQIVIKVNIAREKVHIEVKDSGIGMSKELQQDVFDEFKETSRMGTDGEEGTGFGLPIVKYLVAAYGGYVRLESRPIEEDPDNHGTSFHIYLEPCQNKDAAPLKKIA